MGRSLIGQLTGTRCDVAAGALRQSLHLIAGLENRHSARQLVGLIAQAFCGGGALLNQCSILLGHLIQVADGLVDVGNASTLLARSSGDMTNHLGHLAHRLHDVVHGGTRVRYQLRARCHLVDRGVDQHLDFLGGLGGSLLTYVLGGPNPSVGASGAIFGLIGAEIAFFYLHRKTFGPHGQQQLRNLLMVAGINLVLGFSIAQINNLAHIGGLVFGAALGFLLAPQYEAPSVFMPAGDGSVTLQDRGCLLYTSPSPRDRTRSRMPSSA